MKDGLELPSVDGWYWVHIGYSFPVPCWYDVEEKSFKPAGLGDEESDLYESDIERIGPKIEEPEF